MLCRLLEDNMKVYHELRDSPYKISTGNFTYVFSSNFYMVKFAQEQLQWRRKLKAKMEALYLVKVYFDDYADLVLYSKIEKRGFRVITSSNEVIEWLNQVKLDGKITINKS